MNMTALTLFQIAAEYRNVTDILQDMDVDEQTLKDTLEGESWDLTLKAQNYGFVIRNMEATAAAIKDAEKQMAERRKRLEARTAHLTERLKTGMEIAGVTELSCPHFAIKVKKNPPKVEVYEQSLIPAEYMRIPKMPAAEPDKDRIKEALKDGKEVPGTFLAQGTKLDIR